MVPKKKTCLIALAIDGDGDFDAVPVAGDDIHAAFNDIDDTGRVSSLHVRYVVPVEVEIPTRNVIELPAATAEAKPPAIEEKLRELSARLQDSETDIYDVLDDELAEAIDALADIGRALSEREQSDDAEKAEEVAAS